MADDSNKTVQLQFNMIELASDLKRLGDGIDNLQESQEHMAEDIGKIKEAVYNPDQGLYARLKELETWKKTQSKVVWIIASSVIGLITAALFNIISKM